MIFWKISCIYNHRVLFFISFFCFALGHYATIAATPNQLAKFNLKWAMGLTGEAGFTREQVGKITVTDQTTYVAIARDIAREAVRKLAAGKVKGKTVKVRAL